MHLLYIPYEMQLINICVKSTEVHLANFNISLLFFKYMLKRWNYENNSAIAILSCSLMKYC